MNARKVSTRLLSFLLAFSMVFGMLPLTALNADAASETQYLVFATDRHTNSGSASSTVFPAVLTTIAGKAGVDYVCLGGDMVDNQYTYSTNTILTEAVSAVPTLDASTVHIVAGNHDSGCNDELGMFFDESKPIKSGDDYHVYGVTYADVNDTNNAQSSAAAFVKWAEALTDNKVIVVMSHMPLHAKRGDNHGANYWHEALNEVALDENGNLVRDIIFLHGHNHTDDKNNWQAAVGEGYSVYNYSGSEVNYYTYGTAGYLRDNKEATLVAINDSTITLTRYNTSGATSWNTTFERVSTVAHEHSYTAEVTTAATCTAAGEKTFTCECGDSYTEEIAALGHENDEGAVTVAPTCTKTGVMTYTCIVCGFADEEVLETVDHSYVDGTCSGCGASDPDAEETTAPTETEPHQCSYTEAVTTEATCTTAGEKTFTCQCGDSYTEEIPALGHDYVDGTCSVCNEADPDYEEPTIEGYVLVDTLTLGKDYLIANGNSGEVTLLGQSEGETATVTATVVTKGGVTYIESADAGYVWNATVHPNASYADYPRLINGETYAVFVDASGKGSASLTIDDGLTETNKPIYTRYWTYTDGVLACVSTNSGSTTYYLTYSDGAFDVTSTSTDGIYIFEKQTVETEPETPDEPETPTLEIEGAELTGDIVDMTEDEVVKTVMAVLKYAKYLAYEIPATLAEGATATVTFPIPAEWSNAYCSVYYLDEDDNAILHEKNVPVVDGVVTFTTDHFSTWIVGDVATIAEDGNDNVTVNTNTDETEQTVTVTGTSTTTKTYYVLTSDIADGSSYLIVNGNEAGEDYVALANNSGYVAATDVTIKTGNIDTDADIETYIDLTDATDELWTASGSSSYALKNGSYYLGYSGWINYTFGLTTTSRSWTYSSSNNRLSIKPNSTTYYLRYNNGWSWTNSSSASGRSVYFYVLTTVNGTNDTVYSVTAGNLTKTNPANGDKLTIEATASNGSTLSYVEHSDASNIISGINGNEITLTGATGTAQVKVSYNVTVGSETYEVYKIITVTARTTTTTTVEGSSGMHLYKFADVNEDGTYSLRLSAFATGEKVTTTTETAAPVDVVIVLDMSSSMTNTMTGGSTSTKTEKRFYKVYTAVSDFVDNIYEKSLGADGEAGGGDDVAYRVSIITYNQSSNNTSKTVHGIQCGLLDITNGTSKTTIDTVVDRIIEGDNGYYTASGTRTDQGLQFAEDVFNNYSGNESVTDATGVTRERVVVLFTDGYPSTSGSTKFNAEYANDAINNAKDLKNTYNATVYGILNLSDDGAGPAEDKATSGNDNVKKINAMMHAISSNYPEATSSYSNSTWSVTFNDGNDDAGYYSATTDADELNGIFQNISNSVTSGSSTSVTYDENSVLKDIIGSNFTVPYTQEQLEGNVTVSVYTAEYLSEGNYEFGEQPVTDEKIVGNLSTTLTTGANGTDISVTGFDYSSYYAALNHPGYVIVVRINNLLVAENAQTDAVIDTNGEASGLYQTADSETTTTLFPQPKTAVTSKAYVLDYAKNVTLENPADWYATNVNLNYTDYTSRNDNDYGTFTADDSMTDDAVTFGSKLMYSPKTMQWGGYDTVYVVGGITDAFKSTYAEAYASANSEYVVSKVSVIPANNVYYEDSFTTGTTTGVDAGIVYTNGTKPTGMTDEEWETIKNDWATSGTAAGNAGETNVQTHGWVTSLSDDTAFSDGSAHMVQALEGQNNSTLPSASFTFTGKGMDIYSFTNTATGVVVVKVKSQTTGKSTYYFVDTYANSNGTDGYYQIPVISFSGAHDTYDVTITVTNGITNSAAGSTATGRFTFYLDGIRVYNPLASEDELVQGAYGTDEVNATFTEVRDILLDKTNFASDASGVVFIDQLTYNNESSNENDDTTADVSTAIGTYEDIGPDNEVYLKPGQSITFKVANKDLSYQIGLKALKGTPNATWSNGTENYAQVISHSTDLYYKVTPNANGVITISNNSAENSGMLLAITKIKTAGSSAAATQLVLLSLTEEEVLEEVSAFSRRPVLDYFTELENEVNVKLDIPLLGLESDNPVKHQIKVEQIMNHLSRLFNTLRNWLNP